MKSAIDSSTEKGVFTLVDGCQKVLVVSFVRGRASCEYVHKIGEAIGGPDNSKLVGKVAFFFEGVNLIFAIMC